MANKPNNSDYGVFRTLPDGGREIGFETVTERSGYSIRTGYRVRERLSNIIRNENWSIFVVSRYLRKRCREIVNRVETKAQKGVNRL